MYHYNNLVVNSLRTFPHIDDLTRAFILTRMCGGRPRACYDLCYRT
nr:MAG TPA: hypothetical protein [Caudoviricetes sp.]